MGFAINPDTKYRAAIDLAKYNYQLCIEEEAGKSCLNKQMKREKLVEWLLNLPSGTPVAMEACGTSNYWGRFCNTLGLEPLLINPLRVKPFLSGKNKNDANDALAIMEASKSPHTHFVRVKTVLESTIGNIVGTRKSLMTMRISLMNEMRSHILEHGITIPKTPSVLLKNVDTLLEEWENGEHRDEFLPMLINTIKIIRKQIDTLNDNIASLNTEIATHVKNNECAKRLLVLPTFGPLTATEYLSRVGDGSQFKNGRMVSAWLGLTPSEYSSGGKHNLGGITHRGSDTLRSLMVNGAIASITGLQTRLRSGVKTYKFGALDLWVKKLLEEGKPVMKIAVALANKMARVAWCIVARGEKFDASKACGLSAYKETQDTM